MSCQWTRWTTSISCWCIDWYSIIISVEGNCHTAQCQGCVSKKSNYSSPIVQCPRYPWYRTAYELDAGISSGNSSQAAVSKPLDSVIIASWKSVPCCSSSLFHYCGAWKSACGTATSSWSRTFRRSTSRLMDTARSRQNNTRYSSVKYQLPILSLGRAFFISSNVDTLHFVRGSQEMNCGCFPNRSWTQSLKITLIMSGMHFVKLSTYVDAFWLVVMFIRWSGTLLKSNPSWHWLYRYSLTTCTPLLLLFERALHGYSVPLFLVLHSSLKASAHSLGKKERDVDTLNECASPWPWQQTATMLSSTKDAFKQHVLRAKFHTLIWCKSHIPNK